MTGLAVPAFANGGSGVELVLAAALITLSLVVLPQVGVIANIAMLLLSSLTWLPLRLDPNAWYSGQALMVLLLIAGLDT